MLHVCAICVRLCTRPPRGEKEKEKKQVSARAHIVCTKPLPYKRDNLMTTKVYSSMSVSYAGSRRCVCVDRGLYCPLIRGVSYTEERPPENNSLEPSATHG